jgi:hypothetical protein
MAPVSDGGTKKTLAEQSTREMPHRRTVDLDIPRQVAPLQSLTPLLQASQAYLTKPQAANDRTLTDRIP